MARIIEPRAAQAGSARARRSRTAHPNIAHAPVVTKHARSIALSNTRTMHAIPVETTEANSSYDSRTLKVETVFHFAPWIKLAAIVKSRSLLPSNAGAAGEKPLLWLSANQQWEPTATKMVSSKRGPRLLSFDEQVDRFGCVRFGLDASDRRLLSWSNACKVADIGREERRRLERTGKRLGADPADWFAVAASLPLCEL